MTPRAAAWKIYQAMLDTAKFEWNELMAREDIAGELRGLIWDHVRIWLVGRSRALPDALMGDGEVVGVGAMEAAAPAAVDGQVLPKQSEWLKGIDSVELDTVSEEVEVDR